MPRTRTFRRRARKSGFRDARLVVIACEGANTEAKYFTELSNHFRNSRVHVQLLPSEDNKSSPEHVVSRLREFKRTYRLNSNDELWVVIDVDRWGDAKLDEVARLCVQRKFGMAVSNPCFEFWLLLHVADVDTYDDADKQKFLENKRVGQKTQLEQELAKLVGGYGKANPDFSKFVAKVEVAISRARNLDTSPNTRWPNGLGSRVYKVAQLIHSGP